MKRTVLALFLILSLHLPVFAEDIQVIDVRRNIPLSDDEPVYKDFYLSGKDLGGLKKNDLVQVVRSFSIKDAAGVQTLGELSIPVGQLQVIFVQGRIAVAREFKLLPRTDLPMLEQTGILIGDKLDLSTVVGGAPSKAIKK